MSLFRTLFAAVIGVSLIASPVLAERSRPEPREQSRDQDRAFEAAREGRSMPLPNLMKRVKPFMEGARYLSSDKIDDDTTRLMYMRGDRKIWVDVDGAGRIIRRSKP